MDPAWTTSHCFHRTQGGPVQMVPSTPEEIPQRLVVLSFSGGWGLSQRKPDVCESSNSSRLCGSGVQRRQRFPAGSAPLGGVLTAEELVTVADEGLKGPQNVCVPHSARGSSRGHEVVQQRLLGDVTHLSCSSAPSFELFSPPVNSSSTELITNCGCLKLLSTQRSSCASSC